MLKAEELKRIIMSVAAKVARVHAKTLKYGRGRWEGWAADDYRGLRRQVQKQWLRDSDVIVMVKQRAEKADMQNTSPKLGEYRAGIYRARDL